MHVLIRKFIKITLLAPIVVFVLADKVFAAPNLIFNEQTTSFNVISTLNGEQQRVGDILNYEASLLDPNTNIQKGTKSGSCLTISQMLNGDLLARCEETITLLEGNLFAKGDINQTLHQRGSTETLFITGGDGSYLNARGRVDITQVRYPDLYKDEIYFTPIAVSEPSSVGAIVVVSGALIAMYRKKHTA